MVRERRSRDPELILNIADHQPLRVGSQQELHDAQTRLRPHRCKHISIASDLAGTESSFHTSIILEV